MSRGHSYISVPRVDSFRSAGAIIRPPRGRETMVLFLPNRPAEASFNPTDTEGNSIGIFQQQSDIGQAGGGIHREFRNGCPISWVLFYAWKTYVWHACCRPPVQDGQMGLGSGDGFGYLDEISRRGRQMVVRCRWPSLIDSVNGGRAGQAVWSRQSTNATKSD